MATLTTEQMTALALQAGFTPDQARIMGGIGQAESSGRTDVINRIGCVGLFQINQPVHVKDHPTWTVQWLQNPVNNATAARQVFKEQGYAAWTTYTSGAYTTHQLPGSIVDQIAKAPATFLHGLEAFGSAVEKTVQDKLQQAAGNLLQLPSAVTDALAALEGPVKAAQWLINPASWVRIIAGLFGFVLLVAGLLTLAKAA